MLLVQCFTLKMSVMEGKDNTFTGGTNDEVLLIHYLLKKKNIYIVFSLSFASNKVEL